VFEERKGVVVSGTSLTVIEQNDNLILRAENGSQYPCKCEFIERFDDGSGRPTDIGERGASILISFQKDAFDFFSSEEILKQIGEFPSIHKNI
jgi:hypothetical protein